MGVPLSSSGETLCGAISPTTSVASAGLPGGGSASNYLRSLAKEDNTCNTLPHVPSTASSAQQTFAAGNSASGAGSAATMATNLPLNRNMVMLRNHLRKNTNANTNAATTKETVNEQ